MTTRIYLDVDGVINAVSRRTPTPDRVGWTEYLSKIVYGYTIQYAPELVDQINELAARDDVEIRWLTTWQHQARTDISPALGILGTEWAVLTDKQAAFDARGFTSSYTTLDRWWKFEEIREDLEADPVDKVIWIDDDLFYQKIATNWAEKQPFPFLIIAPHPAQGLTTKQMCGIIDFINKD